jgi:hypothetical protein
MKTRLKEMIASRLLKRRKGGFFSSSSTNAGLSSSGNRRRSIPSQQQLSDMVCPMCHGSRTYNNLCCPSCDGSGLIRRRESKAKRILQQSTKVVSNWIGNGQKKLNSLSRSLSIRSTLPKHAPVDPIPTGFGEPSKYSLDPGRKSEWARELDVQKMQQQRMKSRYRRARQERLQVITPGLQKIAEDVDNASELNFTDICDSVSN